MQRIDSQVNVGSILNDALLIINLVLGLVLFTHLFEQIFAKGLLRDLHLFLKLLLFAVLIQLVLRNRNLCKANRKLSDR